MTGEDMFVISDDLEVADNLYVGGNSGADDDYIYFDAAAEYIRYDEVTNNRFDVSGWLQAENLSTSATWIACNYDGPDGDCAIDFYEDGVWWSEQLRWDDSSDAFNFTDALNVAESILVANGDGNTPNAWSHFGTGTKDRADIADGNDVYISDDLEIDGQGWAASGFGTGDYAENMVVRGTVEY
nr:hypothetical protein [Gammaproteobacteria bacterium]